MFVYKDYEIFIGFCIHWQLQISIAHNNIVDEQDRITKSAHYIVRLPLSLILHFIFNHGTSISLNFTLRKNLSQLNVANVNLATFTC